MLSNSGKSAGGCALPYAGGTGTGEAQTIGAQRISSPRNRVESDTPSTENFEPI
jgi:hypothetical protein